MAGSNRFERVAALIREEIAALLLRGLKDPRIKMASVAEVKVSKDLRSAKVYVQVIGTDVDRKQTVLGLQSAQGFIRRELRERLSLRSVPELTFLADETAEKADRVFELLAQVKRDEEAKAGATGAASGGDDESE